MRLNHYWTFIQVVLKQDKGTLLLEIREVQLQDESLKFTTPARISVRHLHLAFLGVSLKFTTFSRISFGDELVLATISKCLRAVRMPRLRGRS